MANLSTVQDHLEVLRSGTPDQKKQKLTPDSIADVRKFIANERSNRASWTHYSLEAQFHEWEDLIKKYEAEKGVIVANTADAVSTTPRSYTVINSSPLQVFDENGKAIDKDIILPSISITLTVPPKDKIIEISGGKFAMTEIAIDGKRKVWVQKSDIAAYTPPSMPAAQPGPITQAPSAQTTGNQTAAAGIAEIKEALAEINPESLEKAISVSERFINAIPSADLKNTLRWVHGAIIFQILRDAGHNLVLRGGQVEIIPKPGVNVVNLQEKLQTLVRTNRISLDTIKMGMLYSSPSFKTYSALKKTRDANGKELIDPTASIKDFVTYLKDLQKAGDTSSDIQAILQSSSSLNWVNMQQAIRGFQDMGQIGEWINRNPNDARDALSRSQDIALAQGNGAQTRQPSTPQADQGWAENAPSRLLWEIGKGISGSFWRIWSQPGAMMGIFALFLGTWYFKDFKTAFGTVLWAFGITAAWDIYNRNKDSINPAIGAGATAVAGAATSAVDAARWAVGGGTGNAPAPAPAPAPAAGPALGPSQQSLREMIMKDATVSNRVNTFAAAQEKAKESSIGKMEDYVAFIEKELKDVSLSKLFPTDHKQSIFFDDGNTLLPTDSKLSAKMLKYVLRSYLTGNTVLSGSGDKSGETEKEAFLKAHNIDAAALQSKKLSDILESVNNVRKWWSPAAPAPTPAAPAPTPAAPAPTPAAPAPTPASGPSAAPSIKHKIANVDVEVGKSVQIFVDQSIGGVIYDEKWAPYNDQKSVFLKDSNGKSYIKNNDVVKLGSRTIKSGTVDCVEVEYAWNLVYIALVHLKPIIK
jgi:hypothetical protein